METRTQEALQRTAAAMVMPGRGIFAADEGYEAISQRFAIADVESTPQTRFDYRRILFSTPELAQSISAVILFEETLKEPELRKLLSDAGIIYGAKVDLGTVPLPGHPGEKVTRGLDDITARFIAYRDLGAKFCKWRAPLCVPSSPAAISANAWTLALYAAACQEAGLVPIVEPDVLMAGSHDSADCAATSQEILRATFAALAKLGVMLEGIVLKTNMILPGTQAPKLPPKDVARETMAILMNNVPAAVPGIGFLSGGQGEKEATANLAAINENYPRAPWSLTFSFSRALQHSALEAWKGDAANTAAAQAALRARAQANARASQRAA